MPVKRVPVSPPGPPDGLFEDTGPAPGHPVHKEAPWYPRGPFGTHTGEIIENLHFIGKSDESGSGTLDDDPVRTIALSDYSRHGTTRTRVLLISMCAAWCGPCRSEAPELVTMWRAYEATHPREVSFITALAEDGAGRTPTERLLNSWGRQFKVPYDLAIDPRGANLMKYDDEAAYPFHLIVDTRRMVIAAKIVGAQLDAIKKEIDAVLRRP